MPNIITGHNDVLIVQGATNGGWCVYAGTPDKTASEILESAPAAAVADDEGLLEWFADQLVLSTPARRDPGDLWLSREHYWGLNRALRPLAQALKSLTDFDGGTSLTQAMDLALLDDPLTVHHLRALIATANDAQLLLPDLQARPPNPGPEAKPAEHGAPPVVADDAPFARFAVRLATAMRADADDYILANVNARTGYVSFTLGEVRALIRAAGLWTPDMQAQPPEPVREPEAVLTPPPPAEGARADKPVERFDVDDDFPL